MTHHSQENGWFPAPPLACRYFRGMCAKSSRCGPTEDGLIVSVGRSSVVVRYSEDPATGRRILRRYDDGACARLKYSPSKTFPEGSRVKHLHRPPGSTCLGSVTSHDASDGTMTVTYDDGTTAAYPPETHRKLRLYNIPVDTWVEARNPDRKGMVTGLCDGTITVKFANGDEECYPRHTHHKIKPLQYLGHAMAEVAAKRDECCTRKRRREDPKNQTQPKKVPFAR
jgi:hypothetical protein